MSFRINGVELGVDPSTTTTIDSAGRLTAEVRTVAIPPEARGWMLRPPMLFVRALPVPSGSLVTIDDDLLDEHDIGLYVGTHCDIMGQLVVTNEFLRFTGHATIDANAVWRLDVLAGVTA